MTLRSRSGRRRILYPTGAAALCVLTALSALPAAAQPDGARSDKTGPAAVAADRPPATAAEARTAAYLESARHDSGRLRDFFWKLPKGGDLHNHLSGAVSTEYLIELGAQDGLCIEEETMTAVQPPCKDGARPAAEARTDKAFHQELVRAWSMEDFPQDESGHDHFFAAFGKFGEVTWRHPGKLLAEVAEHAARQNQSYLETMATPASDGAKKLAEEVGWDPDPARMHRKLLAGGKLDRLVTQARKEADRTNAEFRTEARCNTAHPRRACRLPVRWISQVSRGSSPERVFTQIALGLKLAGRDPRFVAVNLVQPEDGDSALRNYRLQMRMLNYLGTRYPKAHITLHAGELWPGLVKPEDLSFHIGEAVNVAKAERIGHGVDLAHENNWQQLARTMARRETAVEVPLTSNAQILGVKGDDHPFSTYRTYGVPVVLSTDDPGISRTDISHEYQYASTTYRLRYPELKDLARASLEYAFLPGRSLWRGNPTRDGYRPVSACATARPGSGEPGGSCGRLLADSPKAAAQWRLESAYTTFERTHARMS
ncbi:adenosine deaminase [Streptomyces sp. NPDC049813]|uniref:adenosine deaminase n=1 Tax=Streptomyces sp. NPDC049813 TaxID=3365597 RepID=UPI0037AC622D